MHAQALRRSAENHGQGQAEAPPGKEESAMTRRMHARRAVQLSSALLALALSGPLAAAEDFESRTTSIAEKACKTVSRLRVGNSQLASARVCPGRGGYVVLVSEDDLRETLSVGKTAQAAAREPAASQSYGAFNGYEDKVEWRSVKRARAPFALIANWYLDDQENLDKDDRPTAQNMLVVFRLPPGPVCKTAVVDLKANPDAAALARKAADETARGFNCATDALVSAGQRGRTTEMLFPKPSQQPRTGGPHARQTLPDIRRRSKGHGRLQG
jgi:hypothetical protein